MPRTQKDPILEELTAIKKLLILDLYSKGIPTDEINKASKIGSSNIRIFSKKKIKESIKKYKEEE